jgi:hypothetical protein
MLDLPLLLPVSAGIRPAIHRQKYWKPIASGLSSAPLPGRRILAPRKKNIKLVQRRAGRYVQYCTVRSVWAPGLGDSDEKMGGRRYRKPLPPFLFPEIFWLALRILMHHMQFER